MVTAKPDERTAFWEMYRAMEQSDNALWRQKVYEARHLGAIRLERHRLGNRDGVRASYDSMADILATVS